VKENAAERIKQVAGILRHSTNFVKVLPLSRARCPVVKFVHAPSALKCDLSVNNRLVAQSYGAKMPILDLDVLAYKHEVSRSRLSNVRAQTEHRQLLAQPHSQVVTAVKLWCSLILLHVIAAFDTIDHSVFLLRLQLVCG